MAQGSTAAVLGLFDTYICLYFIVVVVTSVWFWRRSHIYPIRKRLPRLVLAGNAVNFLATLSIVLNLSMQDTTGYPCGLVIVQSILLQTLLGCVYVTRCWVLLFQHELTKERVALDTDSNFTTSNDKISSGIQLSARYNVLSGSKNMLRKLPSGGSIAEETAVPSISEVKVANDSGGGISKDLPEEAKSPDEDSRNFSQSFAAAFVSPVELDVSEPKRWYFHHLYLISPKFIALVFAICATIIVLPALILVPIFNPTRSSTGNCFTYAWIGYEAAQVCPFLIVFIYMAYRLRHLEDGYYIKYELRLTAIITLVVLVIWALLVGPLNQYEMFPGDAIVIVFIYFVFFFLGTVWPLRVSYHQPRTSVTSPDKEDTTDIRNLLGILKHSELRKLFLRHLVLEFSVENLVFWEGVERFRLDCRRLISALPPSAQQSFATFLHDPDTKVAVADDPQAAKEILSSKTTRAVWIKIRKKALHLYNKCVRTGAPYEITLPSDIRQDLVRLFQRSSLAVDQLSLQKEQKHLMPLPDFPTTANGAADAEKLRTASADALAELLHHDRRHSNDSNGSGDLDETSLEDSAILHPRRISIRMFDLAQKVVFDTMHRDSYTRFVCSADYQAAYNLIAQSLP